MFVDRRKLPHDVPWWLDTTKEAYFITINCLPRGLNQLAKSAIWDGLLESVMHRENKGVWSFSLLLAMPDHLHALLRFPAEFRPCQAFSSWKGWTAKQLGIRWQDGFFEHRLRTSESAEEKRRYILANPVRAGLCGKIEDWPFVLDRLRAD
jgi:putative transposase